MVEVLDDFIAVKFYSSQARDERLKHTGTITIRKVAS